MRVHRTPKKSPHWRKMPSTHSERKFRPRPALNAKSCSENKISMKGMAFFNGMQYNVMKCNIFTWGHNYHVFHDFTEIHFFIKYTCFHEKKLFGGRKVRELFGCHEIIVFLCISGENIFGWKKKFMNHVFFCKIFLGVVVKKFANFFGEEIHTLHITCVRVARVCNSLCQLTQTKKNHPKHVFFCKKFSNSNSDPAEF